MPQTKCLFDSAGKNHLEQYNMIHEASPGWAIKKHFFVSSAHLSWENSLFKILQQIRLKNFSVKSVVNPATVYSILEQSVYKLPPNCSRTCVRNKYYFYSTNNCLNFVCCVLFNRFSENFRLFLPKIQLKGEVSAPPSYSCQNVACVVNVEEGLDARTTSHQTSRAGHY